MKTFFTIDAITFRRYALIYVTDDFDFLYCIYHTIDYKKSRCFEDSSNKE